jgi:large subunit ribosomal protein L5
MTMARLQQHYRDKVVPELTAKFGYKSPMQVPRLTKITLNMGVSELSPTRRSWTTPWAT